jgi:hypothetical protein
MAYDSPKLSILKNITFTFDLAQIQVASFQWQCKQFLCRFLLTFSILQYLVIGFILSNNEGIHFVFMYYFILFDWFPGLVVLHHYRQWPLHRSIALKQTECTDKTHPSIQTKHLSTQKYKQTKFEHPQWAAFCQFLT